MLMNMRCFKAYVYAAAVDMRKGHNGLCALVLNEMKLDVMNGSLFFFVSRSRKSAKVLLWDGTGLVVIHKRLERGRFASFKDFSDVMELTTAELSLLLDGTKITLPIVPKEFRLTL